MRKLQLFFPVKPWIVSQPFGVNGDYYRRNGIDIKGHSGLDIPCARNTPIRAAQDGEVSYAGVDSKEGYGVVLRTLEPFEYKDEECFFKTIYWHVIKDIPVKVGQRVRAGDIIGYADSTGFSTGDHLHFGLKPQLKGESDWTWANLEQDNGYMGAIDPVPYLNNFYAEDYRTIFMKIQEIATKITQLIASLKGR